MRFLVDVQLPPALAAWLTAQGHPAQAVRDVGLRNSTDPVIWTFCERERMVVITKDEDFVARALQSDSGPQVVWLRIGNCTNRVLLDWLTPLWPAVVEQLHAGSRVVEVKRTEH